MIIFYNTDDVSSLHVDLAGETDSGELIRRMAIVLTAIKLKFFQKLEAGMSIQEQQSIAVLLDEGEKLYMNGWFENNE